MTRPPSARLHIRHALTVATRDAFAKGAKDAGLTQGAFLRVLVDLYDREKGRKP